MFWDNFMKSGNKDYGKCYRVITTFLECNSGKIIETQAYICIKIELLCVSCKLIVCIYSL